MTPSHQSQKQSAQPPADDSTIATPDDETDSPVPSFQDRTVSCEVESQSSMAHSRCADENKAGSVTETSSSRSIQPQHEMGNTCDRESTTELTVIRDQSYGQQDTQIVSPVSTEATIADDVLRRRRENTGGSARSREVRTATGKNSGIPSKNSSSRPNPATPSPPITSYEQLVQGSISANELFRAASDKLITSQAAKNVADIVSKEIKKQLSQPDSAVLTLNNMSSGHLHVPHLHSRMNRSHKKQDSSRHLQHALDFVSLHGHSGMQTIPASCRSHPTTKAKPVRPLRRGKWTVEEEAYVARVIQDFNSGYLNAPAGTTLRSYLSEKLHCDPMRITKKFTGESCIGKRVFHPAVRCPSNTASIDKAQAELDALERRWRRRLEIQQRESAKKAAASAAAAAHVAPRLPHQRITPSSTQRPAPLQQNVRKPSNKPVNATQTAAWLDRANAILSNSQTAQSASPSNAIENQMKEVQRLINEGPTMKQNTTGLSIISTSHERQPSPEPHPPSDKRARTSGAEDAEALVGFVNSVRAAAAAAGRSGLM